MSIRKVKEKLIAIGNKIEKEYQPIRKFKWFKQRRKHGFDARVTWDLDMAIVDFVLPRLEMYLKVADEFVDLEHDELHRFEWDGGEICLKEAIEIVIAEMKVIQEDEYTKGSKEVLSLFGKIMPSLWW